MDANQPTTPTQTARRTIARRLGRWSLRLLRIGLLALLGLTIVLYAFQTRMIFPGAESQGAPWAAVVPPTGAQLVHLKTDKGDRVAALFGPALTRSGRPDPDASTRPTLVYFYGNGSCLRHVADSEFDRFRRLGVNLLVPEYIGYGLSGGRPSESGCYATADAAYDHLRSRPDVDPRLIVAVGRSLGGAVAIDLASRRDVAGLVVFSTFTTMGDMARRQFPVLPVTPLLRHKFDSLAKIRRVTCPILIGHGRIDRVVPHAMSGALAAAARAPVTTFTVDKADHNDLDEVDGERVRGALRSFLSSLRAG